MFEKYFKEQSSLLLTALQSRIDKGGIVLPETKKDLKLFKEFYDFIKDHIPSGFNLAMGKIRNRTHLLNKNFDLIIYNKWCKNYLKITGGYILLDQVYTTFSIERELTTEALNEYILQTRSLKAMYSMENQISDDQFVPIYSILFAYKSKIPLLSHKLSIIHISEEKEISYSHLLDMVCVLEEGIIIKDWENQVFKIIETKEDTLMWFYILHLEFLDRNNQLNLDLRKYIKEEKQYVEK